MLKQASHRTKYWIEAKRSTAVANVELKRAFYWSSSKVKLCCLLQLGLNNISTLENGLYDCF